MSFRVPFLDVAGEEARVTEQSTIETLTSCVQGRPRVVFRQGVDSHLEPSPTSGRGLHRLLLSVFLLRIRSLGRSMTQS